MKLKNPFAKLKQANSIRPMWNIGACFDIQTGKFYKGKRGESVLCGGLNHFTGVAGLPNMFKTVISLFQLGSVMNRIACAIMMAHDSENTLSVRRVQDIFSRFTNLANKDLVELNRLAFSDASVYTGNEWWAFIREYAEDRRLDKEIVITTPFVDESTGELIQIRVPTLVFLDSLSGLVTDGVIAMYDKADVGHKDLNMVAMKGAAAKAQLIDQVLGVTSNSGVHLLMTAHVGQEYQLDPYKPNIKKLKFLKGDQKLKKVPENFSFLTANCWHCVHLAPMLDSEKLPEFPRNDEDDLKGDTDLITITLVNLRGKSGPSGIPFDLVVSQSEGVKSELTEFVYCKEFDYYGISDKDGNKAKGKQYYRLDLLPSVTLSRKTVRRELESNYKLSRAMNITAEMCMMRNLWHDLEEGLLCRPQTLREDLEAKGYDWDLLLESRGYWVPVEEEADQEYPFLSTMDLLEMRAGRYHPYWYDAALKKKQAVSNVVEIAKVAVEEDVVAPTAADLKAAISEKLARKKAA